MAKIYDLIVVGGGPAGYTGAIRAAKLGMKTALIEKQHLGGTCLNRGCIPTKALLHSAQIFEGRNEWASLGITAENVKLDQSKIYERKDKIVSSLRDGVKMLVKSNSIDLYEGNGEFVDENTISVNGESLNAKFILLATGSSPSGFDPSRPLEGIESALNSDNVLSSPIDEPSVVIIGGGVIAVEFAAYFSGVGKSVTMLVSGDGVLRNMPKDIGSQISMIFRRKKVNILTNVNIKKVERKSVTLESDGEIKTVEGAVVAAVGRKSNLKGFGLSKAGLDENAKFIKVDRNMYTGKAGIYAAGDITAGPQLAHYAAASAITAVESMLNIPHSIDLSVCPSCVYTHPEIAVVGKSETEVENAKIGRFMMGGNGKSMIEGVKNGYIKVIADQNGILKGAELFCVRATDIAGELALAISKGMSVHDAASVIHPHPTVMEAVGESLEDVFNLATHKPKNL